MKACQSGLHLQEIQCGAFPDWLPQGKAGAVCFTVDDVHPSCKDDAYEAGGDAGDGQLGHIKWLLERHPRLHVTLFVTADWREVSPFPTRRLLARIPLLRDRIYLARTLPRGTMRLDRHPRFVQFIGELPRTEVGVHGLHHVHRGRRVTIEFQEESEAECRQAMNEAQTIFRETRLPFVPGMSPPGWDLTPSLAGAMIESGFRFVASARDVRTPVSRGATSNMSGLKGVSLLYPQWICNGQLLHFTSNFQATTSFDRARDIIDCRGLLAIKSHIVKNALGHVAQDGMDELYRNYLDLLFTHLEVTCGDSLWWTTMGAIAERCATAPQQFALDSGVSLP